MYSAENEPGKRLHFGSSGLLYRSNKLMFDRETFTLWHNLTGEAVVGIGAGSRSALRRIPSTVTTWGAWKRAHPDTTVVTLAPAFGARWGFDYRPGVADRSRAGVRFPVWQKSARLAPETEILGVRIGRAAKAYPVETVVELGVANDVVGEVPVAIVAEPSSGALRVFRRREHRFRQRDSGALVDEHGETWTLTEEALHPPTGSSEEPLERLPSEHSFWFGWFGFFPETELFERPPVPPS